MSAEKQYIDLYNKVKSDINHGCGSALNDIRDNAYDTLRQNGFHRRGNEDYEQTDIDEIFTPDYGLNIKRVEIPVNPYNAFHCDVPNMSTWLYFLINDTFYCSHDNRPQLPKGVIAGSLREISVSNPDLIARYYGKIADMNKDGSVALNSMLTQDGFFVYVPKGVVLDRPIQLVNILSCSAPLMANRRILVVIEDDAQAKMLVCDHTETDNVDLLSNQVIELYVGKRAVFDYYDMEESGYNTKRVSSLFLQQEESSNVQIDGITLLNGTTRNNIYTVFRGEHAELNMGGIVISDREQHTDNHTVVDHAVPLCHTNELYKYVLGDNAVGAFSGLILVREGSDKTEAYQSNKNICASPQARMHTKPQLEIYADDVKCSHGTTIGQLDPTQMFYMRTRGLTEEEAKTLLMQAFMNDVVEHIRLEALRDRMRALIEKRFRGELARCSSCGNDCNKHQI